jgi:hypothetical protein
MALSLADREAFAFAEFVALKAALRLTPDQEKNWPPVESALIVALGARAARGKEVREVRSKKGLDLAYRLRDRAKGLRSRAEHIEKLADAAGPLLNSLDEAQTLRFGLVLRAYSRQRQARRAWRRLSSRFAPA